MISSASSALIVSPVTDLYATRSCHLIISRGHNTSDSPVSRCMNFRFLYLSHTPTNSAGNSGCSCSFFAAG
ncbi:hypothetical protein [Salmonella phage PhiSTP2]|nr:hypothetical protein [Salmonella phage PhiSTP2]